MFVMVLNYSYVTMNAIAENCSCDRSYVVINAIAEMAGKYRWTVRNCSCDAAADSSVIAILLPQFKTIFLS